MAPWHAPAAVPRPIIGWLIQLAPLAWIEGAFAEPNPGPVNGALAELGAMQPDLRAPMTTPGPELIARLCALLRRIDAEPELSPL